MCIAHRRWGKDDVALHYTACAAMQKVGSYWHMTPEYGQCRKSVWDAVNPRTGKRRIDEAFPQAIRETTRSQDMFIRFINGSTWQLVGSDNYNSLVGSPPVGLVFSEFALGDPKAWGYLRPVIAENNGFAIFITTPRGKNHAYTMYSMAKEDPDWYSGLITIEDSRLLSKEQLDKELNEYISTFGPEEGYALFRQEWYCFLKGTKIWTDRGQKDIEKVSLGDTVLSHAGRWRKVTQLFQHDYEGDFVEIDTYGSPVPLVCTGNHPIRIADPQTQTFKWVAARDVTETDYLALPRLKLHENRVISEELAILLTWFITEGSSGGNKVLFSLNKNETDVAEMLVKLGSRYGKTYASVHETSLVVTINSTWLSDFLTSNCGSGAAEKRLPWHLISGYEYLVYEHLILGDGCRGDYQGVQDVYTTISYSLALDVQMLAHMIGHRACISKRKKEAANTTILGRTVNIKDSYSVRVATHQGGREYQQKIRPMKHGVATRVRGVRTWDAAETVYNFTVQYDNSYFAEGRSVHNCAFDGAVSGAYYAAIIDQLEADGQITSVPYEPTLPVTTAWDLGVGDATAIWFFQQAGQEIRVIDYFEASGEGLSYYVKELKSKPYIYDQHIMPHDIRVRELGSGKSRYEMAQSLGIRPIEIAKNIPIDDGINAVRATLPRMWFDKKKCAAGLELLRSYRKEYDDVRKTFKNKPLHDYTSHANDALRMYCVGYRSPLKLKPVSEIMARRSYAGTW